MIFSLLKIKKDIVWHLDIVSQDYPMIEKIDCEITPLHIYLTITFYDVFKLNKEDLINELREDYTDFLTKHHPEVKPKQIDIKEAK